jgi:type I restriction enzyme S subunit
LFRVRAGQFIYSRLFAFEGAYGYVSNDFDRYFVSGEYPTFDCDQEKVSAKYLYAYFKNPAVWSRVASDGSRGLGNRRQRVQPGRVLAHRLLLPPKEWQADFCAILDEIGKLNLLLKEIAPDLDALLPSLFNELLLEDR